jgi:glycosyltransferase involved in cell wall biosynthesis
MRDAPLFSIVTVSLNAGSRLLETTESLSHQSFADWEHIVKDGGSIDNSLGCIPADRRRRVIVKEDRGIFDAMNQALAYCSGQYVLFLNAGDRFYSCDILSAVAEIIRSTLAPIVLTNIFYQASNCVRPYPTRLRRAYLYRQIPCQQALYVSLKAYREHGGFSLDYPCLADADLLLRMLLRHKLGVASFPLPGAIFGGGGFSSTEEFRRIAAVERRRLRRVYFTRWERIKWTLGRVLVLHPLRERLNRRFPRGPVARLNSWFTQHINQRS